MGLRPAAQWLTIRRFVDAQPDDELTLQFREELATAPLHYVRAQRSTRAGACSC